MSIETVSVLEASGFVHFPLLSAKNGKAISERSPRTSVSNGLSSAKRSPWIEPASFMVGRPPSEGDRSVKARRWGAESSASSNRLATGRKVRAFDDRLQRRSEEHTSELQSLMSISYAVFCLK